MVKFVKSSTMEIINAAQDILIPDHTVARLEGLADEVGRSAALGMIRQSQGHEEKASVWFHEAEAQSRRTQEITNTYPELRRPYRQRVGRVIDSYSKLV